MSETRWILELLGGEGHTAELPQGGTLVIGCDRARAGFVVEGQGVDETHCVVGRTKEGDWAVKDLGSKYGTFVNGQRVAATRLKLGDQLVLGSRRLEVKPFRVEAARAAVAAVGSARPSEAPQRIGGYRVERLVGKGAMGAVYLAVQESLRRPVALKVLAPKLAGDRDFVHRFQAEARAAAALSHPNVVVVYDVGEEGGQHYLSMEFMAGGSLEQKLAASGPLPWKAVLAVLQDAAAGLAYAESRGIVHRDVKPANLMYSGTGTVKLADLGLATTLEQEAIEADAVPGSGRKVYGTPHFIAPEQARGEPVDNRSDLYALGATAYRLLSGKTPFEGASTREILRALQSEQPRPLRELVPDLPPELDALIARLMEKDPAARFPTAEALRRECERLRLLAEHGPTLEAARPGGGRRLAAVLALLLVGGAGAGWFLLREPPRPDPGPPLARGPEVPEDDAPGEPADETFLSGPKATVPEVDEEALLRERERAAGQALRDIAPFLAGAERATALARIPAEYPGTAAARAAEQEIAALRAQPGALRAGSLEEAERELAEELQLLARAGTGLAERVRAIDGFRVPPELVQEFAARRATRVQAEVRATEEDLKAELGRGEALALDGRFDDLRAHLAGLATRFDQLGELPGDPARYAALRALGDELARRRARVDEEEGFWHANAERKRQRQAGETLGPGSGLLAELAGLELAAVEARLAALPEELRARPAATALAGEVRQASLALARLQAEFASGGWKRKALTDPRTRKVREVRDVRPEGLVFESEGGLETLTWRDTGSDPDWWHLLFQQRLAREWTAEESRAIAALLRLAAATRGAELARALLAPGARSVLGPAELAALARLFEPALGWLGAAPDRPAFEHEDACARRLARALEQAQARAWTAAAAELERLLAEDDTSLLVRLLSDGTDWHDPPAPPPSDTPPAPSNGPSDGK
ncbi:MAG TPA: FHA domain-containing serine/threonine-protein kinase [Planctomycetota bacterium]